MSKKGAKKIGVLLAVLTVTFNVNCPSYEESPGEGVGGNSSERKHGQRTSTSRRGESSATTRERRH